MLPIHTVPLQNIEKELDHKLMTRWHPINRFSFWNENISLPDRIPDVWPQQSFETPGHAFGKAPGGTRSNFHKLRTIEIGKDQNVGVYSTPSRTTTISLFGNHSIFKVASIGLHPFWNILEWGDVQAQGKQFGDLLPKTNPLYVSGIWADTRCQHGCAKS